jgi:hypothetical protein
MSMAVALQMSQAMTEVADFPATLASLAQQAQLVLAEVTLVSLAIQEQAVAVSLATQDRLALAVIQE